MDTFYLNQIFTTSMRLWHITVIHFTTSLGIPLPLVLTHMETGLLSRHATSLQQKTVSLIASYRREICSIQEPMASLPGSCSCAQSLCRFVISLCLYTWVFLRSSYTCDIFRICGDIKTVFNVFLGMNFGCFWDIRLDFLTTNLPVFMSHWHAKYMHLLNW